MPTSLETVHAAASVLLYSAQNPELRSSRQWITSQLPLQKEFSNARNNCVSQ